MFRQKNTKNKHRRDVTTVGEMHENLMKNFTSDYDKLEYLSKAGDFIIDYYDQLSGNKFNTQSNDDEIVTFFNKENNVKDVKNDESEIHDDFFTNQSDDLVLLNLQNRKNKKIQKSIKKRKINDFDPTQKKSIFDFFETENKDKNEITNKLNKAQLQDAFFFMVDKNYACKHVKNQKNISNCVKCGTEKTLFFTEGCYICRTCGEVEEGIMENENTNCKETNYEKQKYPYKKINHLKEKINQFQSKETTDVPDEIYNIIYSDLKKKKIEPENVTQKIIKEILKTNKQTSYYEHLQQIYCKITNTTPFTLSREEEHKLYSMFYDIQGSFHVHKPVGRSNFLNYHYLLNKMFKILGIDGFTFPLLKSKEKLRDQDNIWKKICKDLNYPFDPSL